MSTFISASKNSLPITIRAQSNRSGNVRYRHLADIRGEPAINAASSEHHEDFWYVRLMLQSGQDYSSSAVA